MVEVTMLEPEPVPEGELEPADEPAGEPVPAEELLPEELVPVLEGELELADEPESVEEPEAALELVAVPEPEALFEPVALFEPELVAAVDPAPGDEAALEAPITPPAPQPARTKLTARPNSTTIPRRAV